MWFVYSFLSFYHPCVVDGRKKWINELEGNGWAANSALCVQMPIYFHSRMTKTKSNWKSVAECSCNSIVVIVSFRRFSFTFRETNGKKLSWKIERHLRLTIAKTKIDWKTKKSTQNSFRLLFMLLVSCNVSNGFVKLLFNSVDLKWISCKLRSEQRSQLIRRK